MKNEIHQIPNLRQFVISFVGRTDHRGPRVKIMEPARFNGGKNVSVILSYDYAIGNMEQQGLDHLNSLGMRAVSRCSTKETCTILCDNWGLDFINLEA